MFDRLPLQVQRASKTANQALPTPDAATDQLYRSSYATLVKMVKKLYDNGITIVAGTDQGSGYALHRELEIYNAANGDPTKNLGDIRKIDVVVKGGAVMYPNELYPAMGIRPAQ